MDCNENCRYALKKQVESDIFSLKTNADSNAEYSDLMKKQIERWLMLPQEIFADQIPQEMAESKTGREELQQFFSQFKPNELVPLNYLYQKLSLAYPPEWDQPRPDQEFVAIAFLEKLIAQDWSDTIELLFLNEQYSDPAYRKNYLDRLATHKIIKKMTEYDLISSALNQEQNQALVFFEINGKYDLTLLMRKRGEEWKVGAKIFGQPEIYTRENEAIKQVATLLSKNQLAHAYETLKKFSNIFVDSADFQYYWGFYYLMSKMEQKAQKFLFNAIVIEPAFFDAKALYATSLIGEKRYDEAKKLYEEILQIYPEEIKSMNNLASIHIEQKNYQQAEKLLKRCLEIDKDFEYAQKNLDKLQELKNK
ncbi:MAG: tetratricopeptide repeat protein [Candidatus Cloacimonadales bacterium]